VELGGPWPPPGTPEPALAPGRRGATEAPKTKERRKAMSKVGYEVKVIQDCTIVYEDGTKQNLRAGQCAGAFSDFVAGSPTGEDEGVEVFVNHPADGHPTTGVVPANCVTI